MALWGGQSGRDRAKVSVDGVRMPRDCRSSASVWSGANKVAFDGTTGTTGAGVRVSRACASNESDCTRCTTSAVAYGTCRRLVLSLDRAPLYGSEGGLCNQASAQG